MSLLNTLVKPFLGTGISQKFPFLQKTFQYLYNLQPEKIVTVTISNNAKLLVSTKDTGVGLFLLSQGSFEPYETTLFLDTLKPGDIVLDIGANIGFHSILAAEKITQSGKVYAFEPEPRNFKLLKDNIQLNHLTNIIPYPYAVSNRTGTGKLFISQTSFGDHSMTEPSSSGIEVTTTTLDQWYTQTQQTPNVIKIDVEGAEGLVLHGGQELFAALSKVVVFMEYYPQKLNASAISATKVLTQLQAWNFQIQIIDEHHHQLIPFTDEALQKYLRTYGFTNLLLTK